MKKMKLLSAVLMSTLMTVAAFGQEVEKTLVKSFNLKGKETIVLNLDGNVEVKEWKNDIMRVQMSISLDNGTNSMLKSLVQARRYNLVSKVNENSLEIVCPGLQKQVKISGKELNEKITYIVYAPFDVEVKLADDTTASTETTEKKSSAL